MERMGRKGRGGVDSSSFGLEYHLSGTPIGLVGGLGLGADQSEHRLVALFYWWWYIGRSYWISNAMYLAYLSSNAN